MDVIFGIGFILTFFLVYTLFPTIVGYQRIKNAGLPFYYIAFPILFGIPGVLILLFMEAMHRHKSSLNHETQEQEQEQEYVPEQKTNVSASSVASTPHWHGNKKSNVTQWKQETNCKKTEHENIAYLNGEPVMQVFRVCRHCGGKMPRDAEFCTFCGKNM